MPGIKELLRPMYTFAARLAYGQHLGRFGPIKSLNTLLRSWLVRRSAPILVEVKDHRMYVDSDDSLSISLFGTYEPETTQLFEREVKPGHTVIDIGANVGWYTLIAARLVGEQGRVLAFEPDPANFALLEKNVALNGYHNVVLVQKAVADQNGVTRLYLSSTNKGSHSIYDQGDDHQSIEIEVVRLDDYLQDYPGQVNLIKLDIEGAEGKALQGMRALLGRHWEAKIVTEFSPSALIKCGVTPAEFLSLLVEHHFSIYDLRRGDGLPERVTLGGLLSRYGTDEERPTNLWCVREE